MCSDGIKLAIPGQGAEQVTVEQHRINETYTPEDYGNAVRSEEKLN